MVRRFHLQADAVLWPEIWNPDWDKRFAELYGYNSTRARKLLEEAGYKSGFEFNVQYTFPGSITGFFTHLEYIQLAQ